MIKRLALFAVVFSLLTGCSGNDQDRIEAEQAAIREVLRQDKALGEEIKQRVGFLDKHWNGSALVQELASRMDTIDLTGCPQDFQLAYKRHVFAWNSMAHVKTSNEGFAGFLKGALGGGKTVIDGMSELENAAKQIQATWLEVQEAAIRHGVTP